MLRVIRQITILPDEAIFWRRLSLICWSLLTWWRRDDAHVHVPLLEHLLCVFPWDLELPFVDPRSKEISHRQPFLLEQCDLGFEISNSIRSILKYLWGFGLFFAEAVAGDE